MPTKRFKVIPAVYLIIKNQNDQILFGKRENTGFMDGFLGLPSGHVDGGETLKQAILREAKEEIGISFDLENLELKHVSHRFIEPGLERVDFYFVCKIWEGTPTNTEPEKCSEILWTDLENPAIIPYIKQVLANINRGQFYSDSGF